MLPQLLMRLICLYHGTLCPGLATYKAFHRRLPQERVYWLKYWVIYAQLYLLGGCSDLIFGWLPLYAELKLLAISCIWLWTPHSSVWCYDVFLAPILQSSEVDIDNCLWRCKRQLQLLLQLLMLHAVPLLTGKLLPALLRLLQPMRAIEEEEQDQAYEQQFHRELVALNEVEAEVEAEHRLNLERQLFAKLELYALELATAARAKEQEKQPEQVHEIIGYLARKLAQEQVAKPNFRAKRREEELSARYC